MAGKVYSTSVGNKHNSNVKPEVRRKHNAKTKAKESRNGKGSAYRVPVGDKNYKHNYDKIFRKKDK